MTAEVAIANAGAVALAADSAVTVANQKIYNSAIKLFSLSKLAPVGIMIYGNAGLLNVPWETLIKTYRQKKLKTQTYNQLDEYASDFITFLDDHSSAFTRNSQIKWFLQNILNLFSEIRDEIHNEVKEFAKETKPSFTDEDVEGIITEILHNYYESLNSMSFLDSFNEEIFNKVGFDYKRIVLIAIAKIFDQQVLSRKQRNTLYQIAIFIHTKQTFSNNSSGVVIAGYGENELYPSILTYEIEGIFENNLKYMFNAKKSESIQSGDGGGTIIAFAQEDMVRNFMSGINASLLDFIHEYIPQIFKRLPDLLQGYSLSKEQVEEFSQKSDIIIDDFFENLATCIQKENIGPIMNMVTSLPKDELAEMAEALVNLTAFKRRVTADIESVGGPVDVAVISKGDGLVWVKRKHYFPAELNQHFFANYFRGLKNE